MAVWIPTIGLALAVASLMPGPAARADEHGREGWRDRGHDRHQAHERDRWREHDRYDDYRHRPDVYYSAPPVVFAPRGYYAQPGASLSFSLPFYR